MKRRIAVSLAVLAASLAGCSPAPQENKGGTQEAPSDWSQPPRIQSVEVTPAGLRIRGQAGAEARVVLRDAVGSAQAVSADARGRFELTAPTPADAALFSLAVQTGEETAEAPERLLVLDGGRGPIAVLLAGEASIRLDRSGLLGAVDTDGAVMILSGPLSDGSAPSLSLDGQALSARGRAGPIWWIDAPATPEPRTITVGGQTYDYPGATNKAGPLRAERAGEGWRVGWSAPHGGRQTTWLPDPPR
jgi:hypothetical protein